MGNLVTQKKVLYTVLTGNYERLNELEIKDDAIRAICFTDDPALTSSTWEIIQINPAFEGDSVRSQREIKLIGHPALHAYDQWLYIDNTVKLLQKPSLIIDSWLGDCDVAIPQHSYRESVEHEFEIVLKQKLDSYERITEQLGHYRKFHQRCLTEKPLWTAIIARNNTAEVREWSLMWWRHVLRYSRRDQLSVCVASDITRPLLQRVNIDNYASEFHLWPVINDRNYALRSSPIAHEYQNTGERDHENEGAGLLSLMKKVINKSRNLFQGNHKGGR